MSEIEELRARVAALEQSAIQQLQWWRPFPFHGQRSRLEIWREIAGLWRPEAIVETGTHVGNTAGVLRHNRPSARHHRDDPTLYALASLRLRREPNVTLHLGASADVLRTLPASSRRTFFYLDAHWKDHLPVCDELAAIRERWPNHVIEIDDFEAPGDPGYGFDDYGPGKALRFELIAGFTAGATIYYPAAPSPEDTGTVRGCILVASGPFFDSAATLRKHTVPTP